MGFKTLETYAMKSLFT